MTGLAQGPELQREAVSRESWKKSGGPSDLDAEILSEF